MSVLDFLYMKTGLFLYFQDGKRISGKGFFRRKQGLPKLLPQCFHICHQNFHAPDPLTGIGAVGRQALADHSGILQEWEELCGQQKDLFFLQVCGDQRQGIHNGGEDLQNAGVAVAVQQAME